MRKRPLRTPPAVNALAAWSALGASCMKLMLASGPVIAHRTKRAQSPAEWYSIGTEKVLAGLESSRAMSRHLAGFPSTDPIAAWAAWGRMLGSGVRPYRVRAMRNARSLRKR